MARMDCIESHARAPFDGLAAHIAPLEGVVIVVALPADQRPARRELRGSDLQWVALSPDGRSLAQAAAVVPQVEGRCVVFLQRDTDGWEIITTPGRAVAPVLAMPARVQPPSIRAPRAPTRLDSSWIGFGGTFGIPALAGGLATLKMGPLLGEASLTLLPPLAVYFDLSARAGISFPTRIPMKKEGAGLSLGAMFGVEAAGILLSAASGYSAVLTADKIVPKTERRANFMRVSAGLNIWTQRETIEGQEGVLLTPTIGVAMGILLQPPPPK